MSDNPLQLVECLEATLSPFPVCCDVALGEVTLQVQSAEHYQQVMFLLRDSCNLRFDVLIDLCGVDYSAYERRGDFPLGRFAVVVHLLSLQWGHRLRVRTFCQEDGFPQMDSLCDVWPVANWYEREAFDLFGIIFPGHQDLRRLLTDYGFVGHPFRKDFPVSGTVQMCYDEVQRRVVYESVDIEPRNNVTRLVREPGYGR